MKSRVFVLVSTTAGALEPRSDSFPGIEANRWRDPDEDLPADFETRRAEHYASLRKPLDPSAFIAELREEMRAELDALHHALPRLDWLQIAERREGNIKLTPLDAVPEPSNLRLLKKEIAARWGTGLGPQWSRFGR